MSRKSDIKDKIDALEGKKSGYESKRESLKEYKSQLLGQQRKLTDNIWDPIVKYELGGETGEDWKGLNFNTATEKRKDIDSALQTRGNQSSK